MSDVDNKVKMIVEGCLLAAGRPLTLDNIIAVFEKSEQPDRDELKQVMQAISEDCHDRGFELKQVASGYRFQVKQDLSEWVAKLWEERPPRYTRALLETLALVAYRQPITRGDIEEIRGVAVSANIMRTLLDRNGFGWSVTETFPVDPQCLRQPNSFWIISILKACKNYHRRLRSKSCLNLSRSWISQMNWRSNE